jgi:phosphatidylserine decarboxylase
LFSITKYGYDVVITVSILSAIIVTVALVFISNPILKSIISVIFIALFLFTLYFFRDPARNTPTTENGVICPADGKICLITEVKNDKYLGTDGLQISIFMSPLNVHVNRAPIDGLVTFKKHIPGAFHVAYVDKASELNEQTVVIFEDGKRKILMKQIAGYVARRIVNVLETGSNVKKGDKVGMIKFGSRVDLILPKNTKINVKLNDLVTAGETIIGYLE